LVTKNIQFEQRINIYLFSFFFFFISQNQATFVGAFQTSSEWNLFTRGWRIQWINWMDL